MVAKQPNDHFLHLSPPPARVKCENVGNDGTQNLSVERRKKKINNCIAKLVKSFLFEKVKDEYEKAKR